MITLPQGLKVLFLRLGPAHALPVHRLVAILFLDSLQLPLRSLQLLSQPLNLRLLLHPPLLQVIDLLHQSLVLLLAQICGRALGVLGNFEEAEYGGVVGHGILLPVSSAKRNEKGK